MQYFFYNPSKLSNHLLACKEQHFSSFYKAYYLSISEKVLLTTLYSQQNFYSLNYMCFCLLKRVILSFVDTILRNKRFSTVVVTLCFQLLTRSTLSSYCSTMVLCDKLQKLDNQSILKMFVKQQFSKSQAVYFMSKAQVFMASISLLRTLL